MFLPFRSAMLGPDEILDSGDGFVAAGFVAGQVITVTGDSDNNGTLYNSVCCCWHNSS